MTSQSGSSRRSLSLSNSSLQGKKKASENGGGGPESARKSFAASRSSLYVSSTALEFVGW